MPTLPDVGDLFVAWCCGHAASTRLVHGVGRLRETPVRFIQLSEHTIAVAAPTDLWVMDLPDGSTVLVRFGSKITKQPEDSEFVLSVNRASRDEAVQVFGEYQAKYGEPTVPLLLFNKFLRRRKVTVPTEVRVFTVTDLPGS